MATSESKISVGLPIFAKPRVISKFVGPLCIPVSAGAADDGLQHAAQSPVWLIVVATFAASILVFGFILLAWLVFQKQAANSQMYGSPELLKPSPAFPLNMQSQWLNYNKQMEIPR